MDVDTYIRWVFRAVFAVFGLALLAFAGLLGATIYLAATTSLADVAAVAGDAVKVFRDAAQ